MSAHDQVHLNLNTNTLSINDYRLINESLAEVVVSYTGEMSRDEKAVALSRLLNEEATPVLGSFVELSKGVATGFVALTPAVRLFQGESELAAFKQLASNMYMDAQDDTLWEMREGAAGRYLVRQTQEELPAILASARSPRRAGIPSISSVVRASVKEEELVCFVHGTETDYGVCVGRSKTSGNPVVLSMSNPQTPVAVDPSLVVWATSIDKSELSAVRVAAAVTGAQQVIDYWTQVFGHDREYLQKMIQGIESMPTI